MKKTNKKIYGAVGIFLGILILFSSFVVAFAVSMPSLPIDNEGHRVLYLLPGEEESMTFVVQNGGGATSEVNVKAEIVESSEVIEIIDSSNIYTIPADGRSDVNTKISVPNEAQIGDKYNVVIGFSIGGADGTFLTQQIQQKFILSVGVQPGQENEEKSKISSKILMIAAIIAILIIILLLLIVHFARKKGN